MKLTDYFSDEELRVIEEQYQESDLTISPDGVPLLADLFEGEILEIKIGNLGRNYPGVTRELFDFLRRDQ